VSIAQAMDKFERANGGPRQLDLSPTVVSTVLPIVGNRQRFVQCCGSGMFIPDPNFFNPGSRIQGQKDSGSGSAPKNVSALFFT
jgi:hypothetical protein